ncbi:MAG: sodium:solute symporter [Alphaproteobacteria bacterium]|nr:MAG: sodium:solute symporter [Alphaproteobacteria bacterium]
MAPGFSAIDWLIVAVYLALLGGMSWWFTYQRSADSRDYFLGGNRMSLWVVAISVLATTQSAATFLGGPDQGFRGDFTYLATHIGAMMAALFVAGVLVPRFYALRATTVYDILGARFGAAATRAAGGMYLVGRVLASGARLYLAAIAVSMILYANIQPANIVTAAFILTVLGFVVTFFGGIRSVLWSDLVQFCIYVGSALAVLVFLWSEIPASGSAIIEGLRHAPGGQNKLLLLNFGFDFADPFALLSIVTGLTLLYIGNFGLDQDTTQRLLTCRDARQGGLALIVSIVIAVPVVALFIAIGQLLHVFYERPDLMGAMAGGGPAQEFDGEKITVFMHYILNRIPAGLKGLVAVGVIAAAVSTLNSGMNSMSSVMVQDFYRPWREARGPAGEMHYVHAGRIGMGIVGIALFLMSVLCYYWQRYTNMALLDFALSVMVFAYSGLLGVYFTAVFTRRGSTRSVLAALAAGFVATLLQQHYIVDRLGLPAAFKSLAFTWQLCIGSALAFAVCQLGRPRASADQIFQNQPRR